MTDLLEDIHNYFRDDMSKAHKIVFFSALSFILAVIVTMFVLFPLVMSIVGGIVLFAVSAVIVIATLEDIF